MFRIFFEYLKYVRDAKDSFPHLKCSDIDSTAELINHLVQTSIQLGKISVKNSKTFKTCDQRFPLTQEIIETTKKILGDNKL